MSISRDFAKLALDLTYERLPGDVTLEAKRFILDTLACAVGGFNSPAGTMARALAAEMGGPPEATILGEKQRVGCSPAILANAVMVRYLDYNDSLDIVKGTGDVAGTHPSDSFPAAFAVAERVGASGKQLIEAIVVGYEVAGRMIDAFATGLEVLAFHHGSVLPYITAAMTGKLLRLTEEQLVHAMGIAGAAAVGLDILDAEGEEYTMTKNIADAFLSERGLIGVLLARKGFTGPERIIEGNKGFADGLLRGRKNYVAKPDHHRHWVFETTMKYVCAEATCQGHLSATSELVRENKLTPEQVAEIRIRTNKRTVFHTGDPAKKFPTNKETADHSSHFLSAVTVVDGKVTPAAYTTKKYEDPVVRALIDTVHLEHGPEFDGILGAASVTITTTDGRTLTRRIDLPKGHPKNRMTDDDIRRKFLECADGLLPTARVDRVIETVMSLERVDDVRTVMPLLAV